MLGVCMVLLATVALTQGVYAGIYFPDRSSSEVDSGPSSWNLMQNLDGIDSGNYDQYQAISNWPEGPQDVGGVMIFGRPEGSTNEEMHAPQEGINPKTTHLYRSNSIKGMLVPLSEISRSEVLLDVSESVKEHLPGAVAISYEEFVQDDGALKPWSEIAGILGRAGISQDDSIVIYGECMPCGGGPASSTYVYWLMKSLGHENVRVMDGTIDDWKASGMPTTSETLIKPGVYYLPEITSEYNATYDYLLRDFPQVVDARSKEDFEYGSIPGAINIPYESVLEGDKIKDEAALERAFAMLGRDRPVVVFTQTGIKASVVWFALKLMGFDAKLYSYQDWLANQGGPN